MSLLEYCQILPEHLARKPSEKLNVKEGLISRLSQEIGCEQDFAEVISFLRQQTSIWSAEDINSFEAAARRGLLAAGGKKNPFPPGKTQDYSSFLGYIPKSLWEIVKSCPDDYSVAIHVSKFLAQLGLRMPSEKTVLYITGFVLCVSQEDHSADTPLDLHNMYLAMKKLVRTVANAAEEPMSRPAWVLVLPLRPGQMDILWVREALGFQEPMTPLAVEPSVLAYQCSRIASRKNHKDLQKYLNQNDMQPPAASSSGPASGSSEAMGMMAVASMMKDVLQIVKGNVSPEDGAPIKLLASPRRERKEELAKKVRGDCNILQPYRAQGSNLVPETPMYSLPLPDVKAEEKTENEMFKQAEALRNSLALAKEETPKKRPAAAGSFEKFPNSKTKVAKPSPSEDVKTCTPAAEVSKHPKPKTAAPEMKRPAASDSKKKPAAKGSKEYPDLVDSKGKILIHGSYRRKHWPRGCGKCRQRPGCCISCYRYRGDV